MAANKKLSEATKRRRKAIRGVIRKIGRVPPAREMSELLKASGTELSYTMVWRDYQEMGLDAKLDLQERKDTALMERFSSGQIPERLERAVQMACERHNVTLDRLATKLDEGLESTNTWRAYDQKRGVVVHEEDIDFRTRHKYVETTAAVLRARPQPGETTQQANILVINIPKDRPSIEDWNRENSGGEALDIGQSEATAVSDDSDREPDEY